MRLKICPSMITIVVIMCFLATTTQAYDEPRGAEPVFDCNDGHALTDQGADLDPFDTDTGGGIALIAESPGDCVVSKSALEVCGEMTPTAREVVSHDMRSAGRVDDGCAVYHNEVNAIVRGEAWPSMQSGIAARHDLSCDILRTGDRRRFTRDWSVILWETRGPFA